MAEFFRAKRLYADYPGWIREAGTGAEGANFGFDHFIYRYGLFAVRVLAAGEIAESVTALCSGWNACLDHILL